MTRMIIPPMVCVLVACHHSATTNIVSSPIMSIECALVLCKGVKWFREHNKSTALVLRWHWEISTARAHPESHTHACSTIRMRRPRIFFLFHFGVMSCGCGQHIETLLKYKSNNNNRKIAIIEGVFSFSVCVCVYYMLWLISEWARAQLRLRAVRY